MSAAASAGCAVFVEREGVDGLAVAGLGLGAVVEYPYDLQTMSVRDLVVRHLKQAYRNH